MSNFDEDGADIAADTSGVSENHTALSDEERSILEFERKWWKEQGSKDVAIKSTFGLSATQYYQRLNALIDEPAALEADPLLINRLLRRRESRRRQM